MIVLLSLLFDFTHKKQLNKPDLESKENERFSYLIEFMIPLIYVILTVI
jgi:hypothetical protein